MGPNQEELDLGWKAYRAVQMHERYAHGHWRQLRWIMIACALLVLGALLWAEGRQTFEKFPIVLPILAGWFFGGWNWGWSQKHLLAQDKVLLRLLEEKYGDVLPWIAEEKQMALAEKLQDEIAHSALGN